MKTVLRLGIVGLVLLAFAGGIWWGGNVYFANAMNIHEIAASGTPDELAYILKWSPQRVYEEDRFGRIPLHAAACRNTPECVEQLLDAGSALDVSDRQGRTPLHLAAERNRTLNVRLLVSAGAEVNVADKEGWTPLHCAATLDHTAVAELLLDNGAMVNVRDKDGETPLDWALMLFELQDCERVLRKHGAKTRFEMGEAVQAEALVR